ncbi:Chromosome-partitioning ATPase Soj (plasmid) [Candidatus Rhabdochlamydia oedothoracis]|uniref:Chromosome-partitioning ATPase Soj n=1 Tax=Candidatus Rhabdochlamydia oedothoracis TaxID=2720720 RepID=A0ABX8V8W1_9BACT|nr:MULTISPECIES: ParA family protein [Rhabdochlamydia]KAG6559878.1 Chromosome-partitioning ATPase Soj [Candidatus Rhabdochlamydia sp. W815]QYF49478.1 Chromosome-partitioning ATPase Soj [Candidatus Rhabdochlamydia oedothoracis]
MRKICIALSKGGVAKSSTAVSVSHGIALSGKKVLLIDTDDQGQDAFLLGVKPKYGLADVLNERVSVEQALFQAREGLWVLSGGRGLSGVKRAIGRKDFSSEQALSESLYSIEGRFDFVIVDTSPSWDTLTINALFYCLEVLTPVSLEVLTLNSLVEFAERLKSVQKFNKKLQHTYLLPTFWDRRVKKSSEVLEQLKKYYSEQICEPVKYSVRISEAAGFGKTIYEYAPSSSGAKDYQKTVERILNYGR